MLKNKFLKHMVLILVLILAISAQTSVFADENDFSASLSGTTVEISYTKSVGNYGTLIWVFDTKVKNDDVIDDAYLQEHLVYQTITKDQTLSFTLPDVSKPIYTVIFGGVNFPGDKMGRLKYLLAASESEINDALKDVKAAEGDSIYDTIESYNDVTFAIDLSALENKKQVLSDVFEALNYTVEIQSIGDLEEFVGLANDVATFDNMSSKDMSQAIKAKPSLYGIYGLSDEEIDSIATSLAVMKNNGESLDSLNKIISACQRANAVSKFNAATNAERLDILREFNDIFGIYVDESDVRKVGEREINKLLGTVEIKTPEDLSSIYDGFMDKLLEEAKKKENDSDSSKTGGGKTSKGSGSYGSVPTLNSVQVDIIRGDEPLYTDVDGYDWALESINMLNAKGIMTGDGQGHFRPADNISREEFVKIIVSSFGISPAEAKDTFSDVDVNEWYAPYVYGALNAGIASGMGDGTFGVGNSISRQDAAVILTRACELKYLKFEEKEAVAEFTDYLEIAEYAHNAISYLGRSKIINGYEDGSFRPNGTITRAEAAKLVYGCIKQTN